MAQTAFQRDYSSGNAYPSKPTPMYDDYAGYDGGGTYDKEEQEFIRLQIDVKDLLDDFEHRVLRGEYDSIDSKTGERRWVKYDNNSIVMNEIGVREILARLIGKVTKAGKLTWKDDEEIYRDMFYFDMSITELIAKRCDIWNLDVETAKSIKDAAVELVWDIAASSRQGFTAVNLRSQYSRSDISRIEGTEKSSGGSFLGIKLGSRK